jgi:hypothetical protein
MSQASSETYQKKLDTVLNKTFLDLGTFSLLGFGVGLVASIFFHRPIRYVAAGVGGSYGIVQNQECFHKLL